MMHGPDVSPIIGRIPYRLALAGGWIDQPFVSRVNPTPPGSMVVVGIEPTFRWFMRSGLATGTREAAIKLWGPQIPSERKRDDLVRELYQFENRGRDEPSGSQDMIGLIYPGISRLDYDVAHESGYFPRHIESCIDPAIARWLEKMIHVLPVSPRPAGYNPLGEKNLDPTWITRLGQSGADCYSAILARDTAKLGASLNLTMQCWEALLPQTVRHPLLETDLPGLLACYQRRYPGAMYSGCGGGYLYVISEEDVPGAFHVQVRLSRSASK
jgi:hypothetical protein